MGSRKGVATDAAFKNAGKRAGLDIWRIEKLKPVFISDRAKYGEFFEGDSYICLHTKKTPSGGFEWNIHFWLGRETSQDEMGVAAYKTVELDDALGGAPVQHREVQGHESQLFQSYFKNGLRYLAGGIESGFRKVDREAFEKRLLHIKGRRRVRVAQVPLNVLSLNEGDVFVLDCGRSIYQWNGKDASRTEKAKALEVTRRIRDEERGGKAEITILDQGKDNDEAFFRELGGRGPIKQAKDVEDDDQFERKSAEALRLYRVSDASGSLRVEEVATAPLRKDMLDSNDCFILDQGGSALFAWIGKGATAQERKEAMLHAQSFIQLRKYSPWIPVTRVVEGGETPLFKSNFSAWTEPNLLHPGQAPPGAASRVARVQARAVDFSGLHSGQGREAGAMVDDASGEIEIYRVENFELQPIPKEQYGQFYTGDSYVLQYSYKDQRGKDAYLVYYWQGAKSSQDEKAAAALQAVKLDDALHGAAVQVRVVQNKEPEHFIRLFKGRMIIREGGRASGFKNTGDQDSYDTDGTELYQVRGSAEGNSRAIQVPERASSLNSNDSFVLLTPKTCYIWFGKGCSGDERECAKRVAVVVAEGKEIENVPEGNERPAFWEALGGKAEYASAKVLSDPEARDPRLFQCSNSRGYFYVEEIFDFDQSDLIEDDVMLLDVGNELYVWVGKGANDEEKRKALETAVEYVKTDPSGRDPDTPIYQIKQGYEPPTFTACFMAWDVDKWNGGKTYEELCAELTAGNAGSSSAAAVVKATEALAVYDKTYPLSVLQSLKDLPEGVDPTCKERYLSDVDFKAALGVSRDEFAQLPRWKQANIKKAAKIF